MTRGAEPVGSDRAARAFVWAVWATMVVVCGVVLTHFARNVPITEDWLLVPGLTGHDPHFWRSLWEQNNEHRVPFPALLLQVVLRLADGDFRAGMVVTVALVAAMAAGLIVLAHKVRGRTIYGDAFFPLVLLHLGHWENLFWTWQVTFVTPVLLGLLLLCLLVGSPGLGSRRAALTAGAILVLLPLSGANGVFFVPFFSGWLLYCAFRQWRGAGLRPRPPVTALVLTGAALLSGALAALYFVGYKRPGWVPPNPGILASLAASAKFLALGFGPAARSSWILSTVAVGAALLPAIVVALRAVRRLEALERHRAIGLLVFTAAFGAFAFAVGWGRAEAIGIYGSWPLRYSLLAAPALVTAFLLWTLYAPTRYRSVLPSALAVLMLLLIPFNSVHGSWWEDRYGAGVTAVADDLKAGTDAATMVSRHRQFLHHSIDPIDLANFMVMLKSARMGPWVQLADDPSTVRPRVSRWQLAPDAEGMLSKEFRYRREGASSAALMWGIEGWKAIEPGLRPSGTILRRNVMLTPMKQLGTSFYVVVRVPAGKSLEYGFLSNVDDQAEAWDGDYRTRTGGSSVVYAGARPDSSTQSVTPADATPLISTTVRYVSSFAADADLIWGVNGWNIVPAAVRPGRTEITKRLMKTRMTRDGGGFVATIEAPRGSKLDYGFTITKRKGILDVLGSMWDGRDDHPIIEAGRPIEVRSSLEPDSELREALKSWRWFMAGGAGLFVAWIALYWLLAAFGLRSSNRPQRPPGIAVRNPPG